MGVTRNSIVECDVCAASGVVELITYPNVGELCKKCSGKGWVKYQYKRFTVRRKRKEVKLVRIPDYSCPDALIQGVVTVSYSQFQSMYPSRRIKRAR